MDAEVLKALRDTLPVWIAALANISVVSGSIYLYFRQKKLREQDHAKFEILLAGHSIVAEEGDKFYKTGAAKNSEQCPLPWLKTTLLPKSTHSGKSRIALVLEGVKAPASLPIEAPKAREAQARVALRDDTKRRNITRKVEGVPIDPSEAPGFLQKKTPSGDGEPNHNGASVASLHAVPHNGERITATGSGD